MASKVFQNGEKLAKVEANGDSFYMYRGIVGDDTDGGFQVFGGKSYISEAGAIKAAQNWVNAA